MRNLSFFYISGILEELYFTLSFHENPTISPARVTACAALLCRIRSLRQGFCRYGAKDRKQKNRIRPSGRHETSFRRNRPVHADALSEGVGTAIPERYDSGKTGASRCLFRTRIQVLRLVDCRAYARRYRMRKESIETIILYFSLTH